MNGKGDKRRPEDNERFRSEHDRIFGKKPEPDTRCMDVCLEIQKNMFNSMRMTKLPCQGICELTAGLDVCIGCNRTVQEIIAAGDGV